MTWSRTFRAANLIALAAAVDACDDVPDGAKKSIMAAAEVAPLDEGKEIVVSCHGHRDEQNFSMALNVGLEVAQKPADEPAAEEKVEAPPAADE